MIRSERHTLAHVLEKGGKKMDFHEVDATFRRAGEILNRRPLVVKVGQDNQYYAITAATYSWRGHQKRRQAQRSQPTGKLMRK